MFRKCRTVLLIKVLGELLLYLIIHCFRVTSILLLLTMAWRLLVLSLQRCLLVMLDDTLLRRYLYLVGDPSVRMYPPLIAGWCGWHCLNWWTDRNLHLPLPTSSGATSELCSRCCCCWLGRSNKMLLFPVLWLLSSWPR